MFVDVKKYNRYGKKRFASSILIDNDNEKIIETIDGTQHHKFLFLIAAILLIFDLLTANVVGMLLTIEYTFSSFPDISESIMKRMEQQENHIHANH